MHDVRAALEPRLSRVRGVVVSESIFSDGDAYWCNGKEIAHFEDDSTIEVRLTKAVIRSRREELERDARVELRASASDWLTVELTEAPDVDFVLGLVRTAAQAHRPPAGQPPKPPPAGPDLERRKRFH